MESFQSSGAALSISSSDLDQNKLQDLVKNATVSSINCFLNVFKRNVRELRKTIFHFTQLLFLFDFIPINDLFQCTLLVFSPPAIVSSNNLNWFIVEMVPLSNYEDLQVDRGLWQNPADVCIAQVLSCGASLKIFYLQCIPNTTNILLVLSALINVLEYGFLLCMF